MASPFQVVVAYDLRTRGIGANGRIPWNVPEDRAYFRGVTTDVRDPQRHNAVVMGRATYDSLAGLNRPLPGRSNLVLSRTGAYRSLDAALASDAARVAETVFVIGGEAVYREALASPHCVAVHVTEVELPEEPEPPRFDRFFPALDAAAFALWSADASARRSRTGARYRRLTFVRREALGSLRLPVSVPPHPERAYLDLVRATLELGVARRDRTGTGTRSTFGAQVRFSLRDGLFPLLTTKRVFFRGVLEELLWFVRGSTDARELAATGVHIWDANAVAHAKRHGLPEAGPLGPVYGWQWRRFGAPDPPVGPSETAKSGGGVDVDPPKNPLKSGGGVPQGIDASGACPQGIDASGACPQGIDQLAEVLRLVREDPASRRNVLTAWNPVDLSRMALPPCHLLAQFWVGGEGEGEGELSCMVTMRSCDLGLGLPFNIASYALLAHMVAAAAGLPVGDLVLSLGDAHVYDDHVEALTGQLKRPPRPFPRLRPLPARERLEDYVASDFAIEGYDPHPSVPMAMSV